MQNEHVHQHRGETGWLLMELRSRIQAVEPRGQVVFCKNLPNLEARVLVAVPPGQVDTVVFAKQGTAFGLVVAQLNNRFHST